MSETWKFFLIEISYLVPAEKLGDTVAQHRAFLQTGYHQGWLLLSGPQVPRTGGIVIGRAPSKEAIEDLFLCDPYQVSGLAKYRFVEFEPVKHAEFMEDWVTGTI